MPNDNVIIPNTGKLEEIKRKIMADGPEKLHVVSDFDKTLTSCFVNGKKIVSLISILRDEHHLTPDYSAKAQALYDKYHAFEINPNIPEKEKKKLMHEWWAAHYELLLSSGLNKNDLKKVIINDKISLRSGAPDFFNFLKIHNIPLVIISAAGLGAESILLFLHKFGELHENIYIVSNILNWDKDGNFTGVKEPIIHSLNKNYESVKNFQFFSNIEKRKNVLLLGDSLDDIKMIDGFEYDNIIKIGFLNENASSELDNFKKIFDVIILSNGPMDYVNILLKELFIKK